MNFSLKSIAVAVTLAVAAASANAAIDNGAGGNGELFLNVWDANGSYTRDLNLSIDAFQSALAADGNLNLSFAGDANLTAFLGTADAASLQWNVVAADIDGDKRLLTTFTAPSPTTTIRNSNGRVATANVTDFANQVNDLNTTDTESFVVSSNASAAWAGKDTFSNNLGNLLGFSNGGTLANASFASGLGFMRMDFLPGGTARAVPYNVYTEGAENVNVWLDANKTLHIGAVAAVPEPSEYAMLLAGLGMIGFMARRNKRA